VGYKRYFFDFLNFFMRKSVFFTEMAVKDSARTASCFIGDSVNGGGKLLHCHSDSITQTAGNDIPQ